MDTVEDPVSSFCVLLSIVQTNLERVQFEKDEYEDPHFQFKNHISVCSMCTYENKGYSLQCEMCQSIIKRGKYPRITKPNKITKPKTAKPKLKK